MIIQDLPWFCGESLFVSGWRLSGLLFCGESLSVMPGGVLNIKLSKIKVNLKMNFDYLKIKLLLR